MDFEGGCFSTPRCHECITKDKASALIHTIQQTSKAGTDKLESHLARRDTQHEQGEHNLE